MKKSTLLPIFAVICLALASCTNSEIDSKQAALPDLSGEWEFNRGGDPIHLVIEHDVTTGLIAGQEKSGEYPNNVDGLINDAGEVIITYLITGDHNSRVVFKGQATPEGSRISGSTEWWVLGFHQSETPGREEPEPFVATK